MTQAVRHRQAVTGFRPDYVARDEIFRADLAFLPSRHTHALAGSIPFNAVGPCDASPGNTDFRLGGSTELDTTAEHNYSIRHPNALR